MNTQTEPSNSRLRAPHFVALIAAAFTILSGCDSDDGSNEAELKQAESDRKKAEKARKEAEAELSAAQEAFDSAREQLERAQADIDQLKTEQEGLDKAEADLENAERMLEDAQKRLEDAEEQTRNGAVYAMTVHAFGPDSITTYLATMPSLDEGNLMDLDTAVELPDFANVAGIAGEPHVWLGYSETPTIERWDLQEDGSLKPGPKVSFANLGASSVSPDYQGAFISRELAAVPNQETGELLFWNPTAMELAGKVDLEIPERDGIAPLIRSTVVRPDGTLLVSYYYINSEGEFLDVAGIVIVDPKDKTVVARDEWEGCNYNYARLMPDGTVYLTINAGWAQRNLIYADGPYLAEACLLRIRPGATEFDRDFDPKTLSTLAGGKPITGNLEPVNADEAIFVAWHEELMTERFTAENFDDLSRTTPAFKWYRWNMKEGKAAEIPGEPFAALPEVNQVDGKLFYADQRLANDNGGLGVVPFYELTTEGVKAAFVGFGKTWTIARLR